MIKTSFLSVFFMFVSVIVSAETVKLEADETKPASIELPAPELTGGKPFMETLTGRKTIRDLSPEKLSDQQISNILYSAWGINRKDESKRTVPTAMNKQDLSIYVLLPSGVYFYDGKGNKLEGLSKGDYRKYAAGRPSLGEAGYMTLVIVSDLSKWPDKEIKYPSVHAGSSIQNVYLYCSSSGLGAVVCGSYDDAVLTRVLNLSGDSKIILTQVIGVPLKK